MSMRRFVVYFFAIAACAVSLFPRVASLKDAHQQTAPAEMMGFSAQALSENIFSTESAHPKIVASHGKAAKADVDANEHG